MAAALFMVLLNIIIYFLCGSVYYAEQGVWTFISITVCLCD